MINLNPNINLLPPEIKRKIKRSKQSANIFSICLVIIIGFIVLNFLLFKYESSLLQSQLDSYKTDIINTNNGLKKFDDLQKKALFLNDRVQLVSTIQNSRAAWSPILQNMINNTPDNVQFISLLADPTKMPNFVLQGTTISERDAVKFKEKLESASFFKNVVLKSSTTSKTESSANKFDFILEFNLEHTSASQATK